MNVGMALDNGNKRRKDRTGRYKLVRLAWFACAALSAVVLLGALPIYYGKAIQSVQTAANGSSIFSLQLVIVLSDLASSLISYGLALLLFWRKPDDRMALFASFFFLITAAISGYALDYFLTAYFGAPSTYHLWSSLQTSLWVLLVVIFPDGRFVPRWTRWLFIGSIFLSVPRPAGSTLETILNLLILPLMVLVVYGQVYRYRHVSSDTERKQTKWWVYGLFVGIVLALVASLIYKNVAPPLFNVTPIFVAIAILRSRLWDIDIIIRRTLIYGALTATLAFVYLASVLLLQGLFYRLTGQAQADAVIVLSTLTSVALFAPLRSRIQRDIDRRFYRRKYDAQKVLAGFAARARDEVDLNKLTDELLVVVQDTVQPEHTSLWLRESSRK